MSAISQQQISSDKHNVTQIDVNARIDYVLRFSKQTVLVIDDDKSTCSHICHQFLSSLPENHNAAFLSLNNKLNDIQIRCRIIEQLFSNLLFDPEHSLAKTIITLAKTSNKEVSIVIENGENLSLQLLHELCQISAMAKKSNVTINVVIAAGIQAAKLASSNISLFTSTLAIVSGNGQLLPLNSTQFKETKSIFSFTLGKKIVVSIAMFSLLLLTSLYYLMSVNNDYFTKTYAKFNQVKPITNEAVTKHNAELEQKQSFKNNEAMQQVPSNEIIAQADVKDILTALSLTPNVNKPQVKETAQPVPAEPADIMNALHAISGAETNIKTEIKQKPVKVLTNNSVPTTTFYGLKPDYYIEQKSGFVVQISANTDQKMLDSFLLKHQEIDFFGYHRKQSERTLLILTSKVFSSKSLAQQHQSELAKTLGLNNTFIKSVTSIINEINVSEDSQ